MRVRQVISRISNEISFFHLQNNIHPDTLRIHNSVIEGASLRGRTNETSNRDTSRDALVERGGILRKRVLERFQNKLKDSSEVVLVHVPTRMSSPAGYSIFLNLIETLNYLGVPCHEHNWNMSIQDSLNKYKPTIFLTSDSENYINNIDWTQIKKYRYTNKLKIGLTATIEAYGSPSLHERLRWGKRNEIDFYYSFRDPFYLKTRNDYQLYYQEGYSIVSYEFGANPIVHYPVDRLEKPLPFVFLGSSNSAKHERYTKWFSQILKNNTGFINGPGWRKMHAHIPMALNKYIYSRALVGVNLHLEEQVLWANELNERTYTLAACGVPQLVDNPMLLGARFSSDSLYVATSPAEYYENFCEILTSQADAQRRAMNALEEVFEKHTTFHRAENFMFQISSIIN